MGNVKSATINGQQVSLITDNAYAQVTVYSPSVIRVRIDKKMLGDDFSFAVIAQPQKTKANISQTDQDITIVTDSVKAVISKMPFSVNFTTLDGKVISQDETNLITSWVNESVTTYKKIQAG
jgi:alpha-glucosidase